jgi:hypothetical protein
MTVPDMSGKWTLRGVAFPSAIKGFAVGYDYTDVDFAKAVAKGIILEYVNGAWKKAVYPEVSANWQLNRLWFLNENEGWATGFDKEKGSGILMHYKNCKWESVKLPATTFTKWILYNVFFLDEKEGWAVGGSFGKSGPVLLHYKDTTWKFESPAEAKSQTLMTVIAKSTSEAYAGGFREGDLSGIMQTNKANGSYIINTAAAGWAKVKLPLMSGNVICEKFSYSDDKNLYAAGWMPAFQSAPRTGKMLHFDGKKWEEVQLPDAAKEWTMHALDFSDASTGWAVGCNWSKNKGIFLKFNKGEWAALDKKTEPIVSEDWSLYDVVYDGSSAWYAVGSDSKTNKGIIMQLK